MDLNFLYREHFMALVAAENAPTTQSRKRHVDAADRLWTMIERAKTYGTEPVAA